jgi:hypothetical protein
MRAGALLSFAGWLLAAQLYATAATAAAAPHSGLDVRETSPVVAVNGTQAGQTGYVHFFIVRTSADDWETQVGIEMPDQRIAWSFFELGVVVSPFVRAGFIPAANGRLIEVQYLYGLRPLPDEASMRVLRAELEARVSPYAEAETPYCIVRGPSDAPCLSCLSFVLRMLFPGTNHDDTRAQKSIYTTDDLLLYLAGVQGLREREARLRRIDDLALPADVREDLVRLATATSIRAGSDGVARTDKTPPRGRRLAKPTSRTQQLPRS